MSEHEHHAHHNAAVAVTAVASEPEPETATADPNVAIQPELVERRIYAVYKKAKDSDELEFEKFEQVSVQDFEKWEGLDKNKHKTVAANKDGVPAIVHCKEYSVGSLEGLRQLINDEAEAVNIANKGLSQKTSAGVVKELTAVNEQGELTFDFSNPEPYDTMEILQKISNRRLSPMERAARELQESAKTLFGVSNVDLAAMEAFIRQMQAAQS